MVRPDYPSRIRGQCLAILFAWIAIIANTNVLAAGSTRSLPFYFEDLVPFRVFIEVVPSDSTAIQAVQESVPPGWTVTGINYGGTLDSIQKVVRWGPFADNLPRTLAYQLTPPLDAPSSVSFQGSGVFQDEAFTIGGPSVLNKRPGVAIRTLPTTYLPGESVNIAIAVRPGASVLAWALQEAVPSGWTPFPVPAEASFDPSTRTLKWGPFLDPTPREFRYTLKATPETRSTATFSGLAHFESTSVPVSGASILPIQPNGASRIIPPSFRAGETAAFELHLSPAPFVTLVSAEEDIPEGLTVQSIDPDGAWDPVQRRIKWGPFIDASPRTLRYSLTVPGSPGDSYFFEGRAQFDGDSVTPSGPTIWPAANAPITSTLVSSLAAFFDPRLPLELDLQSTPSPGTQVHAVELPIPTGWSFVSASHGGVMDAVNRRIKWGPFQDDTARTLHSVLQPPGDAVSPVSLSGVGWFDARLVPATGNRSTQPFPSVARRTLPARFTPGASFTVRIEVQPASTVEIVFLEEIVPVEATVSGLTEGGTWDAARSKIKWGPFTGNLHRTLSYQITLQTDPRRTAVFAGNAVFNSVLTSVEGPTQVYLNHAPTPQPELLPRTPAANAKFSSIELLANDSDVDGDALRILKVDPQSTAGGTVRLVGPWIFYDAPSSRPAEDQFSYTIEDRFGATAVTAATIHFSPIPVASRLAIVEVIPQPGGKALVRFRAVPGTLCRIEVSRDLRNWSFLAEATAGLLGTGEVLDPDANAFPVRFYRASAP